MASAKRASRGSATTATKKPAKTSESRDRVTRFAADLVEDAAVEGARESRSATQQLDYWVRLGRAVSSSTSRARSRIEDTLAGSLAMSALTDEEGTVLNAEVTAAIERNLADVHYGQDLAAAGITTVALDENGEIVEYRPDGSAIPLPSLGVVRRSASTSR